LGRFQRGVICVDVRRVKADAGLAATGLGSWRRRREGNGRDGSRQRYLDPPSGIAHWDVDDFLEAERLDVEIDSAVGVGDGDADTAYLREIQLGHRSLLLVMVSHKTAEAAETHRWPWPESWDFEWPDEPVWSWFSSPCPLPGLFGSDGTGATGSGVVGTVLTGGSLWSWFRSPRPLPGFFFDSVRTVTTGGGVVGTVLAGGVGAGGLATGEAVVGVGVGEGGGVVGVVTGGPVGLAGGAGLVRFFGGLGRLGLVRVVTAGRTSTAGRTITVFGAARCG
ncbi:MAG: hypothetical protein QOC73_1339, partial [Actinomycetota bacterium]|nr:hypothetical protein [Actinomycetota bacterium]